MKNKIYYFILLHFIFLMISCKKENLSPSNNNLNLPVYSWERVLDGKSNTVVSPDYSTIFDFRIDKEDKIWLGSDYLKNGSWVLGLWNFDGSDWKYFQGFEDKYPNAIDEAFVSELRFDNENNLWFGLKNKLVQFNGQEFLEYDFPYEINSYWLKIFTIEENGKIWLGGDKYFASFLDGNWEIIELPNIEGTWFYDIEVESNAVWISTKAGLFLHANDETNLIEYVLVENGNQTDTVQLNQTIDIVQSQNQVYFGTDKGVLEYDGANWNLFNKDNSELKEDFIYSLAVDKEEKIYIGVKDGLFRIEADEWIFFDSPISQICSGCSEIVGSIKSNSKNEIFILVDDNLFQLKE